MCYSATASFVASAGLMGGGLYLGQAARPLRVGYRLLALTPIFFGIQQLAEGFVWLGLIDRPAATESEGPFGFALLYLFFALFFWNSWFSSIAVVLESKVIRRRLLMGVCFVSLVFGAYLFLPSLLRAGDAQFLQAEISHKSISYNFAKSSFLKSEVRQGIYVSFCVLIIVLTSVKRYRVLGALLFLSAVVLKFTNAATWLSTWCFWCALFSLYIIRIVRVERQSQAVVT